MKISALILVKNEESMIEACLRQLSFADEILVLDQQSNDKTVEIARRYSAKITETKIFDFDKNRQHLATMAKGEWLLYVDADERIDKVLKDEILKTVSGNGKYSAFYFSRKNIILDNWLKHGGWWPDYVPKLFRRDKLIGWIGRVHESPKIDGEFGYLRTPLIHYTARDVNEMLMKTQSWAKIEAELLFEANSPKVSVVKVIKGIVWVFVNRYIILRGFLDGFVGLAESLYQSLHRAIILVYLWELQNGTKERFIQEKLVWTKHRG